MEESILFNRTKVEILRRLNDRSGVYEFDNVIALFINCFEESGADRAPASMRKYANQFLLGGTVQEQ